MIGICARRAGKNYIIHARARADVLLGGANFYGCGEERKSLSSVRENFYISRGIFFFALKGPAGKGVGNSREIYRWREGYVDRLVFTVVYRRFDA